MLLMKIPKVWRNFVGKLSALNKPKWYFKNINQSSTKKNATLLLKAFAKNLIKDSWRITL